MRLQCSNRIAFVPIVLASMWVTAPITVTAQTGSVGDATSGKEYRARVREQLPFCLDTLTNEFNNLDERHSLATRVDVAEQLMQFLARERPAQARKLLDSIFAESLEALKRANETSDTPKRSSPGYGQQSVTSTIGRILRLAARLDAKLEKVYLKTFLDAEREIVEKHARTASDRLKLGVEIIDADPNWAFAIAKDSLGQSAALGTSVLDFLYQLHKKDPALADRLLAAVLNNIKARRATDVNDLLLIHSYIAGLSVVPFVSAQGLVPVHVPYKPINEPAMVSPSTAALFYRVASELLLDNNRYNSNLPPPLWGMEGDLVAIRILEHQISQLGPDIAAAMVARKILLASYVAAERSSSVDRAVDQWSQTVKTEQNGSEASSEDRDSLLERASKAAKTDEKDQLYYQAADLAIAKGEYLAALEITDKISEPVRQSVNDFIVLTIARAKLTEGRGDKAREWAKKISDATQRAYMLTLIARSSIDSKRKAPDKTAHVLDESEGTFREVLDEAQASVGEVKESGEKVPVLAGIGNTYLRIDQNKAYSCLQDTIAEANSAERYSSLGPVNRFIRFGNSGFSYSLYDEKDLSLSELIVQQSRRDFFATLSLVDGIKNPLVRIRARIALYRGAHSEKSESQEK